MKKCFYITAIVLFLALQFFSLNHLYDSGHFFVHDSNCEQCRFLDQSGSAGVPDEIEPEQAFVVYLPMPDTNVLSVYKPCFFAYFGQAPPYLI